MIEVSERLGTAFDGAAKIQLSLNHEQRDKGRLRVFADDGEEIRIFLERGVALKVGEFLRGDCGTLIQVQGALEPVLRAETSDWQCFSRACYHLGNRHVKIQLGSRWLRITPDHVLAELLTRLGLTVREEQAVFVPEPGAYGEPGQHHH